MESMEEFAVAGDRRGRRRREPGGLPEHRLQRGRRAGRDQERDPRLGLDGHRRPRGRRLGPLLRLRPDDDGPRRRDRRARRRHAHGHGRRGVHGAGRGRHVGERIRRLRAGGGRLRGRGRASRSSPGPWREAAGEMRGFAITCDAAGVGKIDTEGEGIERAMRLALERAGVSPSDVVAVWANRNGLEVADEAEAKAIERLLGPAVPVLAPKLLLGEPMGAGAALATALALEGWARGDDAAQSARACPGQQPLARRRAGSQETCRADLCYRRRQDGRDRRRNAGAQARRRDRPRAPAQYCVQPDSAGHCNRPVVPFPVKRFLAIVFRRTRSRLQTWLAFAA